MFEVILSPEAQQFFASAAHPLARKLARCLSRLETDPRGGNTVKRLKGKLRNYYRYRVGNWRVVYRIDDAINQVIVVAIAHRSDIYE
jgi:mRNA interferase RelE/StbE